MVRGASKVDDGGKSKEDASGQSQVVRARSLWPEHVAIQMRAGSRYVGFNGCVVIP